MHLADISMFFAPEGGGVGRYLSVKQAWLARHTRWRHTILAPSAHTSSQDGIELYRTQVRASHGYRFPLQRRPWTRRLVDLRPDLIEAGDPYGLAWAALEAGQTLGVPVVGFYHSDVVNTAALRFGAVTESVASRYARTLYRRFDLVLAPSRHTTDRLRDLGIERVLCQPLGVDTDVFHPARRTPLFRAWLGLPTGTRLLVFAGRFAREKNIDLLLDVARKLGPPYHLVLIGSGGTPSHQRNVTVLPYQRDPATLATIIASCDVFIHAGNRETFGLVALEAMACALPVVALKGGAISELVERTGLVVAKCTPAALAEGVTALFAADLEAAGWQARQWVEQHSTWDNVLRSLLVHYGRVLGLQTAPAAEAYAAR